MPKPIPSKNYSYLDYTTIISRDKFHNQSLDDLKLTSYIKQQRLTDSLELLESFGYYGDVAIFVLGTFQVFGGVA